MKTITLLLGGAAAPFLVALSLPAERIAFGPSDGTQISKTFTLTSDMNLEDMDMLINGSAPPMDLGMEISGVNTTTIEITDTYASVAGGQPAKLVRSFDAISLEGEGTMANNMTGEVSMSLEGESELIGTEVAFSWDEDSGEYSVAFADDEEGDEELLEDLVEDMDLRGLLPDGEVEIEGQWEIDPNALKHILSPGGDLQLDLEMEGGDAGMGGAGSTGMDGNYGEMMGEADGTFTGTLTAVREIDGRRIAVIALAFEIDSSNDMTDMMREEMADMEMPAEAGEMDIESLDVELEMAGEGQLLWDLEGGHFHSLELSLEISSAMDTVMAMSMQGMDMEMEQTMDFSATQTVSASAERQ